MIIAQGAEAVLKREGSKLVKERIKKGYRIRQIDEKLRKSRTRQEARLIREAKRAGILVPQVLDESKFSIDMEFIEGSKIRDILNEDNCGSIAKKIAEAVARLHNYDIIHGDLTTSNMILKDNRIYLIDFGLGFRSQKIEDKAIDLYLLHEALESTHFNVLKRAWKIILETYKQSYEKAEKVIKTLSDIEKRGRYQKR
jgi:Kae1-associated kinase Bud32